MSKTRRPQRCYLPTHLLVHVLPHLQVALTSCSSSLLRVQRLDLLDRARASLKQKRLAIVASANQSRLSSKSKASNGQTGQLQNSRRNLTLKKGNNFKTLLSRCVVSIFITCVTSATETDESWPHQANRLPDGDQATSWEKKGKKHVKKIN